ELDALGLAEPGFDTIADITACPGTDTCALGVTNSTGLAQTLEALLHEEFPELITESNLHIKISGCMNSCGQHMAANIGFHGSSIRNGTHVLPAMQVVLGGGVDPQGRGFIAEKVIKLPTKRIPDALRALLLDYETHALDGEYFNDYFQRRGKRYFYDLLKPLADLEGIPEDFYRDWGQEHRYVQQIGVGECAGVAYDLVATILNDARERLQSAAESLEAKDWPAAIYYTYTAFVIGAKALLLAKDLRCNTHKGILEDFDAHYVQPGEFPWKGSFEDSVLEMNAHVPSEAFARAYHELGKAFFEQVLQTRAAQLNDKVVLRDHYKA
ncbi:MAG: HEPN domain-containing protein, partial [Bacteroidetes bacterium]